MSLNIAINISFILFIIIVSSLAVTLTYLIGKAIYYFIWRKKNSILVKTLYTTNYKLLKELENPKPFGVEYSVDLKNMLLKTMFNEGFLISLDYGFLFHELQKSGSAAESRLKVAQQSSNPRVLLKYKHEFKHLKDLLIDLQEMEHSEFLKKHSLSIENMYKLIVIEPEEQIGMKKYDILPLIILRQKYTTLKNVVINFFNNENPNEIWFATSTERQNYIDNIEQTLLKASSYFLYRKMYSGIGCKKTRKKVSEYLKKSADYHIEDGKRLISTDTSNMAYEVQHYLERTNNKHLYSFEIVCNNEYIYKRFKALSLKKLLEIQLSNLTNIESIDLVQRACAPSEEKIYSDIYLMNNPYDAIELANVINKALDQYATEQDSTIMDYIREEKIEKMKDSPIV